MPLNIISTLQKRPNAFALVKGSSEYPQICGKVQFHQTQSGVIVMAEINGLPISSEKCKSPIFAFHIHSGESCSGNKEDPFADALMHYNPDDCLHPYHAGDMVPLFGNNGFAFSAFLTDRFSIEEIIGRTVIIHSSPDDFMTQPSGNSGAKIACGKIVHIGR